MAQKSRRYAAVFYVCLLITVILVGFMFFSDDNGETLLSSSEINSADNSHQITLPAPSSDTAAVTSFTPSASSARMVIRWTNKQLRDILSDSLKSLISSAEISNVELEEPNTITINGRIPKDAIQKLLEEAQTPAAAAAEVALKLAPQKIDLCISCSATVEQGTILLTPHRLCVENVEIPCEILPEEWLLALNNCMKTALTKQQCTALELDIQDGSLSLDCEVGA